MPFREAAIIGSRYLRKQLALANKQLGHCDSLIDLQFDQCTIKITHRDTGAVNSVVKTHTVLIITEKSVE